MKEEIKLKLSSGKKGIYYEHLHYTFTPGPASFWKDSKPGGSQLSVVCKVSVNRTFPCAYTLQKSFPKLSSEGLCSHALRKALEAISSCAQWPSVWSWLIHWNLLSALYSNKRVLFFLYFCSISLLISTHGSEVFIVLSSCLISTVIPSAERRNRSVNCTVLYFSDTVIISPDKNRQLKRFDFLMSSLYCNSYLQYFYCTVLIVVGLVSSDQNCIQSLGKQRKNPGCLVKSRKAHRRQMQIIQEIPAKCYSQSIGIVLLNLLIAIPTLFGAVSNECLSLNIP